MTRDFVGILVQSVSVLVVWTLAAGPERVETSDHLPVGEMLEIKVLLVEPNGGKVKLSRKALLPMPAVGTPYESNPVVTHSLKLPGSNP
jgi:hypothetical protein